MLNIPNIINILMLLSSYFICRQDSKATVIIHRRDGIQPNTAMIPAERHIALVLNTTEWWCYPNTCMRYGACHRAMLTTHAGCLSNQGSRGGLQKASKPSMSAASGSGGLGDEKIGDGVDGYGSEMLGFI
jgi:hypothetical protein